MNPQEITANDSQLKKTNLVTRVILVVVIGMNEFLAILFSYWVAGWLLPAEESEFDDERFSHSNDGVDYKGKEFFWFLVIVVVVSSILQCLFLCLLACLFHISRQCREKPPYAAAEHNVESNALHFVGSHTEVLPSLSLASLLEDDCSNRGACSFEATCHLVGGEPYYSAEGNLTIRQIDHPAHVEDRNPLYYSLSGHGHDTEGPFQIEHGRLSPSGMFFWIQTSANPILGTCLGFNVRRKRQQRLVTGLLDTDGTSVRRGYWQKDSGEEDGYTQFDIKKAK